MKYLSNQDLSASAILAVLAAAASAIYFPVPVAVSALFLTFLAAGITISDARRFIIPDALSLPAIPAGVAAYVLTSGDGGWHAAAASLLGALIGGISLFAIKAGYARLKGVEGLGLGDVKLFAAGGAWLGPENLAPCLLLASLAALVAVAGTVVIGGKRDLTRSTPVPFGAFIAPAIWLVWFYGQASQRFASGPLGM
jgi:leader peptidase (prepilin peptidase) / N-methyltransferase